MHRSNDCMRNLSTILLRVMRSRGVLSMAAVISDDQPLTDCKQSLLHSSGSVMRSPCTSSCNTLRPVLQIYAIPRWGLARMQHADWAECSAMLCAVLHTA